jgi:hypothetical protein
MSTFALGYWALYDSNGNKLELTLPEAPDAKGIFQGTFSGGPITGHWNSQTNEIVWEGKARLKLALKTLNPMPTYKGHGFAIKSPIEVMAGTEYPSPILIHLTTVLGVGSGTPQPWMATWEGLIIQ